MSTHYAQESTMIAAHLETKVAMLSLANSKDAAANRFAVVYEVAKGVPCRQP